MIIRVVIAKLEVFLQFNLINVTVSVGIQHGKYSLYVLLIKKKVCEELDMRFARKMARQSLVLSYRLKGMFGRVQPSNEHKCLYLKYPAMDKNRNAQQ